MDNYPDRPGYKKVFSKYITLRNGRRLYARECGKEAFCFYVKID